jgi:hypothetical protein
MPRRPPIARALRRSLALDLIGHPRALEQLLQLVQCRPTHRPARTAMHPESQRTIEHR